MCLHPLPDLQQLLSALFCNFPQWRTSLRPVTRHCGGRCEPELFTCRVNTSSTTLHLLVWLHCGLLSPSCLLTGSGSWGLVSATYCDMLTKRAGTSTFGEDSQEERKCVDARCVVSYTGNLWQMWLLSVALCWRVKATSFPPFYLMDKSFWAFCNCPLCAGPHGSPGQGWPVHHKFFLETLQKDCWTPSSHRVLCLRRFFVGPNEGADTHAQNSWGWTHTEIRPTLKQRKAALVERWGVLFHVQHTLRKCEHMIRQVKSEGQSVRV